MDDNIQDEELYPQDFNKDNETSSGLEYKTITLKGMYENWFLDYAT